MAALNAQSCLRARTCRFGWKSSVRQQFPQNRSMSSTRPLSKPKDEAAVRQNNPVPLMNELRSRGLVNNTTNALALNQAIESGTITAYCGVDPTAGSLHLGNLMTLMPMIHLYARGHNIIPLIGGFTCQVGDPSGKTSEREKMSAEVAASNIRKISEQVKNLFDNFKRYASSHGYKYDSFGQIEILNNNSWWKDFSFSNFLTKVAKHMRLGPMIARESVKLRLQSPEGIDAASFLYQSLQAYDFLRLCQLKQCRLQVGGSDQWGNITAGVELCQKVGSSDSKLEVFGLTVPLLLSPSGEKFGKSAGNALFLDPTLTHPFDLYQYFLRTLDDHAEQYLKIFTLLPLEQIRDIVQEHAKTPEKRLAQRTLAEEVVSLVHRSHVAEKCIFQTAALYPAPRTSPSPEEKQSQYRPDLILRAFQGDNIMLKKLSRSSVTNLPLSRLVKEIGLTTSYSEAYRSFQNGGVYINGVQERRTDRVMDNDLLIDGKIMVIRHGKSSFRIVEVVSDEEAEYHERLLKQDGSVV